LEQLYFKMTGIRIKICRQTGSYGTWFWFVPNCEWSIFLYQSTITFWVNVYVHEIDSPTNCTLNRSDNVKLGQGMDTSGAII